MSTPSSAEPALDENSSPVKRRSRRAAQIETVDAGDRRRSKDLIVETDIARCSRELAQALISYYDQLQQLTTNEPDEDECESILREALDHAKKAEAKELRKQIKGMLSDDTPLCQLKQKGTSGRSSGRTSVCSSRRTSLSSNSSEPGDPTGGPELFRTSPRRSFSKSGVQRILVDSFQTDVELSRQHSHELAEMLFSVSEQHAVDTKKAEVDVARRKLEEAQEMASLASLGIGRRHLPEKIKIPHHLSPPPRPPCRDSCPRRKIVFCRRCAAARLPRLVCREHHNRQWARRSRCVCPRKNESDVQSPICRVLV